MSNQQRHLNISSFCIISTKYVFIIFHSNSDKTRKNFSVCAINDSIVIINCDPAIKKTHDGDAKEKSHNKLH